MSQDNWLIWLILVFATAFLLAQTFMTSTFGENRQARRRIRKRLSEVASSDDEQAVSLLRQEYLSSLSPLERRLEALPGMESLRTSLRQAGRETAAYQFLLISLGLALVAGLAIGFLTKNPLNGIVVAMAAGYAPFWRLARQRRARLELFEEQFPEALDTMGRALRAGHPYNMTLKLVSEELSPPVAEEFGIMFNDVNYGGDHRRALLNLLDRVPSVTVMGFVTAVLIQKESGGNLAELLQKLAKTVRDRFKFQRQVATLSAAGKLSAWILALEPFFLFGVLWVVAPGYIKEFTTDPRGIYLMAGIVVLLFVGILWTKKVIKIDV